MTWIPFGGYSDMEPPDEEYAHIECWNKAQPSRRELVTRVAWVPPFQLNS